MNDENDKPKSGDWGMTVPHLRFDKDKNAADFSDEFKPNPYSVNQPQADDWEITAPKIGAPKQDKQDDWSMPAPVFRVSEGEKVDNLPKRTLNFNRTEADDYDKTTPNFNLSELSPPYPYGSGSANLDSPPPGISETIPVNLTASAIPKTEKAARSKFIYVFGGLIMTLFFAIIALALVYFLFLRKPDAPQKIETPKEESKQTSHRPFTLIKLK